MKPPCLLLLTALLLAWSDTAYGQAGVLQFEQARYPATEGATNGAAVPLPTVWVTRTGGTAGAVSASYCFWASEVTSTAVETTNNPIKANTRKYVAAGTLSWADGDGTPKAVSFPAGALVASTLVQGTITCEGRLANVSGGAGLGENALTRLEIRDAQAPAGGVFNFTSRRFYGPEGGSVVVSVRRDGGPGGLAGSASVGYAASSTLPAVPANGVTIPAGVAGVDYLATGGRLNWADGDDSVKSFTIPLLATGSTSGTMNVAINLSAPSAGAALGTAASALLTIQHPASTVFDLNDHVGLFTYRVSLPPGPGPVRGVLYVLPGTAGDFRGMATDPQLRAVADVWRFAIVGIKGNSTPEPLHADQPHVSMGWLFDNLAQIAGSTGRPEIRNAPFAFLGFSAGAFTSPLCLLTWPERTLGIISHRGWASLSGSDPFTLPTIAPPAREVPALSLPGATDTTAPPSEINLNHNQFRRQGLDRGTLAMVWGVGHSFSPNSASNAFALYWLDQVMAAGRYPATSSPTALEAPWLGSLPLTSAWWGARNSTNSSVNGYQPAGGASRHLTIGPDATYAGIKNATNALVDSWLPGEAAARAYQAFASLPAISFSTPAHFDVRTVGEAASLTVNVGGNGADLNKVEFFDGNTKLGEDLSPPYAMTWTPTQAGLRGITAVASSAAGPRFSALAVVKVNPPPSGWTIFRATHQLPADGSQDTAVPARDGVSNLLKYAFNLIGPSAGQTAALTIPNATVLTEDGGVGLPRVGVNDAGRLQITFLRRKDSSTPGILSAVEFSDTLAADSWAANPSAVESVTSLDATLERVTLTDSVPYSARRFARVRVRVSAP